MPIKKIRPRTKKHPFYDCGFCGSTVTITKDRCECGAERDEDGWYLPLNYTVVEADTPDELCKLVDDKQSDGWKLMGPFRHEGSKFRQTMRK